MSDWSAFLLTWWICSFLSIEVSKRSTALGCFSRTRKGCMIVGLPPLDIDLLKQSLCYDDRLDEPPTFHEQNLNCGRRSLNVWAITGGQDAAEGAWPWQVLIRNKGNNSGTCGGTLIDKYWVLTAAHCLISENVDVIVGITDVNLLQSENIFQSSILIRHENFDPSFSRSGSVADIALVKLKSPVTFSRTVTPACLATAKEDHFARTHHCYITGFGSLEPKLVGNSSLSDKLQQLQVEALSEFECERRMLFHSVLMKNSYICVKNFSVGAGTCKGDRGGPLSCLVNGLYYVVGVASFGDPLCFQFFPNVYMRVAVFKDWILQQMKKYA